MIDIIFWGLAMSDGMLNITLPAIASALRQGEPSPEPTVRNFLWMFEAQRRGASIVQEIRYKLSEAGLVTEPDFEEPHLDSTVVFKLAASQDAASEASEASGAEEPVSLHPTLDARTFRISRLAAADQIVVRVAPTAPLAEVMTLMMARDFSQLPVMTNERDVKGVVSWKTIGAKIALNAKCLRASDAMIQHAEVNISDSIFDAIPLIEKYDYVLVRSNDRRISGIVTATDLARQYHFLSEPFLLLNEIETLPRIAISRKFSVNEVADAIGDQTHGKSISKIEDMSFGHYHLLLSNETRWPRFMPSIDRKTFCSDLDTVRMIRNRAMHFDPDGLEPSDNEALRDFAAFLRTLTSAIEP